MSDFKTIQDKNVESRDEKLVLTLEKPIIFEGKDYKEIDLSGLQDLRAKDLIRARKMFLMNNNAPDVYAERTIEFACCIASIVSGKPISLFENLYATDSWTLRNMVMDFF